MGMARALEVAEEAEIKLLVSGSPFASPTQTPHPLMASSANNNNNKPHSLDFQQMHHLQLNLDHHHHHHPTNQISFGGVMMPSSSSSTCGNPTSAAVGTYIGRDGGGYDLGELDQALFLYLDGQPVSDHQHPNPSSAEDQRQNSGMRPPTLNIFPSQPMHVDPSTKPSNGGGLSQSTPTCTTGPKRPSMKLSTDPKHNTSSSDPSKTIKVSASLSLSLIFDRWLTVLLSSAGDFVGVNLQRQGTRGGPTSNSDGEGPKIPDPKTLRRLAQNRQAARKSRLRKKAYVQQLESVVLSLPS